ncbi:MAG TPA: guanylate kinase [Anaerolineales bacterium]|nr:guanylate kinase [Anaerolineales bacterium]
MTTFQLPPRYPLLIVISGPSGVGKDSALLRLKERDCPFHFVVTATTRPARSGEVHGVDYFFISLDEFAEMIDENELLEYANVYGDYKGIPKQQVRDALASGKDVIMRLDVQGAATIKTMYPSAVTIFLTAESEASLEQRLRERRTETDASLKLRIATARKEMRRIHEFDYCVVNYQEDLDQAVDLILGIINTEHLRVNPRKITL